MISTPSSFLLHALRHLRPDLPASINIKFHLSCHHQDSRDLEYAIQCALSHAIPFNLCYTASTTPPWSSAVRRVRAAMSR